MKRAVVTVIFNEDAEVLLLKRTSDHEHFPDQWCLPGGKIDIVEETAKHPDGGTALTSSIRYRLEFPEETAYRETFEETGIKLKKYVNTNTILCDGKFLVNVFVSKNMHSIEELAVNFPNREHAECRFFARKDLPELGDVTKSAISCSIKEFQ